VEKDLRPLLMQGPISTDVIEVSVRIHHDVDTALPKEREEIL
jgi:GMP synthase PP-ATPase subunit